LKESMRTWQERAENILAQGCLTYSKSRRYYAKDQPSHCKSGRGQYLILPDGSTCLDTVSGFGANLIDLRNSFSLPATLEVEYAERIVQRLGVPGWKVKLVKTGSEADQCATRFARGFTGRKGVLKLGYSGWHNEFIAAEEPGIGCIPTDVIKCNDYKDLISHLESDNPAPAAVIMEPVQLDMDVVQHLKRIRDLCNKRHVVLIFDEVITCFRMPQYTVSATYNVWPDLLTTGKAAGGGYPLGICMGHKDIMDTEGVFVSGTFSGETSALLAGMEVLDRVTPSVMSFFFARCQDFQTELQWAVKEHISILGYGTRQVLRDKVEGSLAVPRYMQEMWNRHKILIGPVLFPRVGWDTEIYGKIINASEDVMKDFDQVTLNGSAPRPIFKR